MVLIKIVLINLAIKKIKLVFELIFYEYFNIKISHYLLFFNDLTTKPFYKNSLLLDSN
ncbi:hypothetical protein GGR22_000544 [Flavobacterium gossypii]|uniref:Uncharacterized protein n=1 Tax=Flavobacterium gossypii TaxID=1646119 RepID=A0ABR6DL69_9FLAO|nr:hypothetical protein [Flavobacterium gossypii]